MQIISNDKTVRSNTVQDFEDFNSQSLAIQVEKRRTISFSDGFQRKTFDLMADDEVRISIKNESLKNKIGSNDEKWLEESKARLL